MPGLILHFSNRTELLVDELASLVAEPLDNPLTSEVIVVQSQGMARWLSQQVALRHGIWANCRFLFPNAIVSEIFNALIGEDLEENLFSPEILQWRILGILPQCLERPEFSNLKSYLSNDGTGLKELQLAEQIANVFDHYTIYRSDLLFDWERGKETHWQAFLWRSLARQGPGTHCADRRRKSLDKLQSGNFEVKTLPPRISVFGIPQLPPFHLDVLTACSQFSKVHMFFMNPTMEYWGEILSEKQQANIKRRQQAIHGVDAEDHFETGNPLLASFGNLGKEYFGLLLDRQSEEQEEQFDDPGEGSLLHCIQSDILHLRTRGKDLGKKRFSSQDHSIRIHSCHGPMREMEVLYDYLLSLFEKHPDLQPHHILVMAPDIEKYAPFIEAVFESESNETKRIPFAIADRGAKSASPVIQAFLKILHLVGSRLKVTEVVDLLDSPCIHQHFGISAEEMVRIHHWLEETRIHWGMDSISRLAQGLADFPENTWKAGLDRLILGYALPPDGAQLLDGILAFGGIEGKQGQLLGQFLNLLNSLFETLRRLEAPHSLTSWSEALLDILATLFEEDEDSTLDFQLMRSTLRQLSKIQERSQYDRPIRIESLRYHVERLLDQKGSALNFLTGRVTFCAMLPMRSIPFRMIAMVGMNHDSFPRHDSQVGFDLIGTNRRRGDRSLREEDRYLFLEAVLSARDALHISYVGQSTVDNSELPPSGVISDLQDVIEQGFDLPQGIGSIVMRHPLQAYSPSYFSRDSRWFSYSKENCEGLAARESSNWKASAFVSEPISEPGKEWRMVDIKDLQKFLQKPTEFLLHRRLGLLLQKNTEILQDAEPFSLDSLDDYTLKQDMLEKGLQGIKLKELLPYVRAKGVLPPQVPGEVRFRQLVREVETYTENLLPYLSGPKEDDLDIDCLCAGFQLRGMLRDVYSRHLLRFRCADLKPKDRLAIWVEHLVLNHLMVEGYPLESVLVGQDGVRIYQPVKEPGKILEKLLDLYWRGLCLPLHFFPSASWSYAEARHKGKSPEEALQVAQSKWNGNDFIKGMAECQDPYHWLGFRDINPLDEEFESLSMDIFGPLIECERVQGN